MRLPHIDWTNRRNIIAAAGAVLVALALVLGLVFGGCGRSKPAPAGKAGGVQSSAPAKPGASSGPAKPKVPVSPFTGKQVKSLNRVLAVKIDNVWAARPPTGLNQADVVYVLPIEQYYSRILAVYSTSVPGVLGPVRSVREADLEILRQYGHPAFAYSGATPVLLPYVHQRDWLVDLYSGISKGWFRDGSRLAPHNLYCYPGQLMSQAGKASEAKDIGFRFGPAPAGGKLVSSASASYANASFKFIWSPSLKQWVVSMDGKAWKDKATGKYESAPTIVIQRTTFTTSRFLEYGSRPPFAKTVGSGEATVLRDGKAYQVHWSRPVAQGGTAYTTASGERMTFAPGQVWIVLAPR